MMIQSHCGLSARIVSDLEERAKHSFVPCVCKKVLDDYFQSLSCELCLEILVG